MCDNQIKLYPGFIAFRGVLHAMANKCRPSVLWFGPVHVCVSHANINYVVPLSVCNAGEAWGKLRRDSSNLEFFLAASSVLVLEMPLTDFLSLLHNFLLLDEQYSLRWRSSFLDCVAQFFSYVSPLFSSAYQDREIVFQIHILLSLSIC